MKPIQLIAICVICAATLMSGCLETTTTDEHGTATYNFATDETIVDIDMYEDGFHITGTAVYDGDEMVSADCTVDGYMDGLHLSGIMSMGEYGERHIRGDVDGYIDGQHVTGTFMQLGDTEPYYDLCMIFDTYEDGLHLTGECTLVGADLERWDIAANVDGYIEGCHVTGTMSQIGYGDMCHNYYAKVDRYAPDGHHVTGYKTLKGCGDDVEWYSCLTATKDGYKTQYMNGYGDAEWRT